MWVQCAVRAHRSIWNERQHDKCRAGENQSIIELVFCEDRLDEAMQSGPGGEQNSNGHREAGRERGFLHRKPTEQGGDDQCDFGR